MKHRARRLLILAACSWTAPALLGGCAGGLELAAVGAAASATEAGETAVKRGKIKAAHLATLEATVRAAEHAIEDAGLTFTHGRWRPDHRVELQAEDEKGATYNIRIERRTPRLVRYQLDVGWFGHNATARLLLNRMQVHLAEASLPGIKTAMPDAYDWASE